MHFMVVFHKTQNPLAHVGAFPLLFIWQQLWYIQIKQKLQKNPLRQTQYTFSIQVCFCSVDIDADCQHTSYTIIALGKQSQNCVLFYLLGDI